MPVYGSYSHCSRCYCCFHVSTSEIFLNYTDAHDVDESVATIGNFGGHFNVGEVSVVGMLMRYLDSYTTKNLSFVASSNMKIFDIIRIRMMSTKMR